MFLGDCGVGKTSLISNFIEYEYRNDMDERNIGTKQNNEKTICVDYFKIEKKIDDKLYRINIWDVSGNELENKVLPKYLFKSVDLYVLVFSLDNVHSLNNLKHWIKIIDKKSCVLVKNKSDLRKISDELIKKFQAEIINEICLESEFETYHKSFIMARKLFYFFFEKFSGKSLETRDGLTLKNGGRRQTVYKACQKCW